MGNEKLHAVVARSTFRSQNAKKTGSDHSWSLKCNVLGREVRFKSNMAQSTFRTALWREAHFEVKSVKKKKNLAVSDRFLRLRCGSASQQWILHLTKSESNVRVSKQLQDEGKHGTFERDLQRCISRGRRSTRDMFIKEVRRSDK